MYYCMICNYVYVEWTRTEWKKQWNKYSIYNCYVCILCNMVYTHIHMNVAFKLIKCVYTHIYIYEVQSDYILCIDR